ncbi:MAG: glucosamine-6-phosphate deaminase [candidate division KSB1 bacterium]|nr:glucosamine-6-phosphate deaminase [candidate division KSB1 bacterium]
MEIIIEKDKAELGRMAAMKGARFINEAIEKRGTANIILATGASQFEMLAALQNEAVNWGKVRGFHLDEYIGLSPSHPASFRKYLKERFVDAVPLNRFYYVDGNNDPEEECARLEAIISDHKVDVAFIGIGENGHLAFNDPPADFDTEFAYITVTLDDACRKQQMGEGWFDRFEDVPDRAISMSIRQIMKSGSLICTVPDQRKAAAVKKCVEGPVTPELPSSILQRHPRTWLYLDHGSASELSSFKIDHS